MINHTEFANGILSIWQDRSRWDGVLAAAARRPERWSPQSRGAWASSFQRWPGVKASILECAGASERDIIGLEALGELALDRRIAESARMVAQHVAGQERIREWRSAVARAVERVDAAVTRLPRWVPLAQDPAGEPSSGADVRSALEELSDSGAHLKTVLGGSEHLGG